MLPGTRRCCAAAGRRAVVPAGPGEALPGRWRSASPKSAGSRDRSSRRSPRRPTRSTSRAPKRRRSAPKSALAEADGRHGLRAGAHRAAEVADPPAGGAARARDPLRNCLPTSPTCFRYRGLIQSLVARELKARYRGSVLGFFWSFINPLLLLLIYSFVFTIVMPNTHRRTCEPYALFMFCGILPWTWFSSSLIEVVQLADRRRQPDQEGAVSGRSAADRHRAGEHGALLPRPADPGRRS